MDARAVTADPSKRRESYRHVHIALVALFIALAAWSWRRWPDIQVDFGRELYAPWRLNQGDRLYSDIAWFNGPLSAYWNALWFRIAGDSLGTLVGVNLALLVITLKLLHSLVIPWAGCRAAATSVAATLCLFAFGRHAPIGNYNFVTPYSHELTHGLLLGFAALSALARSGPRGALGVQKFWALIAGVCLGLTCLTKAEIAVAAITACTVKLTFCRNARQFGWFTAGFVTSLVLCLLTLSLALGKALALHALMGAWLHIDNQALHSLPFYSAILGSQDITGGLMRIAGWTLGVILLYAFVGLTSRHVRTPFRAPHRAFATLVSAAGTAALMTDNRWQHVGTPLPGLALVIILVLALPSINGVLTQHLNRTRSDALAFAVFSLVALGKMILRPQLMHYGFVLALPASALCIAWAVGVLPGWFNARRANGEFLSFASIGSIALICALYLNHSHAWYHGTPRGWPDYAEYRIGQDGDAMKVRWRGEQMAAAIADLNQRLGPDDDLLVLPEGVMLNYLLRRSAPSAHINYMPPELLIFGEEPILQSWQASPPRVVAIVHKDTSEYGLPRFGQHYGQKLMGWIREHYSVRANYGAVPLTSSQFGIAILEPRESKANPSTESKRR